MKNDSIRISIILVGILSITCGFLSATCVTYFMENVNQYFYIVAFSFSAFIFYFLVFSDQDNEPPITKEKKEQYKKVPARSKDPALMEMVDNIIDAPIKKRH